MSSHSRYAVYLAPAPDSDLWRFGSLVLGRDAASGNATPSFAPPGHDAGSWRAVVDEPRRYGFHATLKAPFRLESNAQERDLSRAVGTLAHETEPFDIGPLRVSTIPAGGTRGFVALTLAERSEALERLEASAVRKLDGMRAPLTAPERARRKPERLTPRQRYYLDAWGYPYVLDEFRLHFTLSGAVDGAPALAATLADEYARRVPSPDLRVDALVLFVQPGPGEDFQIFSRFPFG